MEVLLIAAIVAALTVGFWCFRASVRAGRGADWRANRDGLRPPDTSESFKRLHLVSWPVLIALVAFGASSTAVLTAALAYAVGFATMADQERRRAVSYYRGNAPRGS